MKKIAGVGIVAAVVVAIYLLTRPADAEDEPDMNMSLTWEEV